MITERINTTKIVFVLIRAICSMKLADNPLDINKRKGTKISKEVKIK